MFCPNCGAQAPDGSSNCPNCGVPLAANSAPVPPPAAPQGNPYGTYNNGNPYNAVPPTGKEPRNIAIAIILTIVTCGIYGIYWFIVLTNETNEAACEPNGTSGGIAFLLTLVTCGIYGFYWAYKQGEKIDKAKNMRNSVFDSTAVWSWNHCICTDAERTESAALNNLQKIQTSGLELQGRLCFLIFFCRKGVGKWNHPNQIPVKSFGFQKDCCLPVLPAASTTC